MHPSIPERLQRAPIPGYVRDVLQVLQGAGHQAFLVGGCVRDVLRGLPPKDFDVATSARPEAVLALFPKTVPTGLQHGTVTVVQPGGHVEVTTFRGEEGYQDGRRPDRVFFLDAVEGDLARRDFTINAIAFDPLRGRIEDPFGGAGDLGLKLIRCVGAPQDRFGEDGLRPLRAVRFASVLRFAIDPPTLAAIPEALPTYGRVAVERIADELRKLLKGPRPSRGLELLVTTGLSARILPALASEPPDARALRFRRVNFTPRVPALRLAALFWGHAGALEALKLSNELNDRVAHLDRFRDAFPLHAPSDAALRRFASLVTRARVHDVLVLTRAELLARGDRQGHAAFHAARAQLRRVLAENPPLTLGELALKGADLIPLLGGPGPHIGQTLRRLLDAVLDDPTLNTPEGLRARLS